MSALGRHPNGSTAPDDLLRMAKEQQQQEVRQQQMLMMALQKAMRDPLVVHQVNTSMCGIGISEDGTKTLLIALASGERTDIVLSDQVAAELARGLLKEPEPVEKDAA